MDTHETDQNYNKYIAQRLGLDESFDFMNDSEAIHRAEEEISQKNLENQYLQALNEMDASRPAQADLNKFSTREPNFRAFAMVKMFRKEEQ